MDGKQNSSQGSPPGTSLEAPHSAPSPELSLESHPSRSQIRATDKVLTESPRCCCQQPALPPCLRASGAPSPAPAPAFAPHIRKDVKPSISHFWGHHSQSGGIFWGQTPKGTCLSLIQKSEFNILHKNYQTATTHTRKKNTSSASKGCYRYDYKGKWTNEPFGMHISALKWTECESC